MIYNTLSALWFYLPGRRFSRNVPYRPYVLAEKIMHISFVRWTLVCCKHERVKSGNARPSSPITRLKCRQTSLPADLIWACIHIHPKRKTCENMREQWESSNKNLQGACFMNTHVARICPFRIPTASKHLARIEGMETKIQVQLVFTKCFSSRKRVI